MFRVVYSMGTPVHTTEENLPPASIINGIHLQRGMEVYHSFSVLCRSCIGNHNFLVALPCLEVIHTHTLFEKLVYFRYPIHSYSLLLNKCWTEGQMFHLWLAFSSRSLL